ncbi:MAG: TMEM175 family protein [Cyclobacteriaceae bacterium]
MMRSVFKDNRIGMNKEFRLRGEVQTRLETFSDAVFALSITLLIVSTSVPESFDDMIRIFADFIPFAFCMALITYIWYEHFLFFIRFGFRNKKIVLLNAILLFLILFFVYPLKFLSKILVGIYIKPFLELLGGDTQWILGPKDMISEVDQMSWLLIIYGLFGTSIFFIMGMMYKYALNRKEELKLNEIEEFDTKASLQSMIIMGSVPLFSVLISLLFKSNILGGILGGFIYMLYIPLFIFFGKRNSKKRIKLLERLNRISQTKVSKA